MSKGEEDRGEKELVTLVSEGPACLVSSSSEDAGVGQKTGRWVAQRPDTGEVCPVLLSDSAQKLGFLTRRWKGPVVHDRTCLVGKRRF